MGIVDRFKAAAAAFKSLPFQTGSGGSDSLTHWGSSATSLFNPYPRTAINYANEVGDLGGSSLIMAAVNWTGTVLPEAPVQVLQRKSPKVFEPLPEHPLVKLLERPNPYYSGDLLWKAFGYSWIVDGNVFLLKVRNPRGQVIQLWYEPHFTIRARWPQDGSEFISYYEVNRDGKWLRVESSEVIHFRYGIDPANPRQGLSPVGSVLREIFTDGERARYSALTLKNGGVVPYLISPDSTSQVGINKEELKEEWQRRTTGDNVGKPIVLNGPVKVQQLGLTPKNLMVDEASMIPETRIAAVIGIPGSVLGFKVHLDRNTYSNMAEAREAAYESFLIPTQRLIAAELQVQLLPEFGDTSKTRVAHDLSQVRVLQPDRDKLFERELAAYRDGVKKRGEARSALGLETTPEDDVYFVQPRTAMPDTPPVEPPPLLDDDEALDAIEDEQDDDTKSANGHKPPSKEIDAAIDFWRDAVPDGAAGLIDAETVNN